MKKVRFSKIKEKRSLKKVFYTIIIAFAIVSFWRGVWQLMDMFLFPNNYLLSNIASVLMGIIILYLTKHLLDSLV
jgi:hypothetical protein|tara:strand:+ start:54 stop:278 length:225 start_codon:yes stop_codon:yes gene_type:complete